MKTASPYRTELLSFLQIFRLTRLLFRTFVTAVGSPDPRLSSPRNPLPRDGWSCFPGSSILCLIFQLRRRNVGKNDSSSSTGVNPGLAPRRALYSFALAASQCSRMLQGCPNHSSSNSSLCCLQRTRQRVYPHGSSAQIHRLSPLLAKLHQNSPLCVDRECKPADFSIESGSWKPADAACFKNQPPGEELSAGVFLSHCVTFSEANKPGGALSAHSTCPASPAVC